MDCFKLGELEQKFANIIWENEPVISRTLTEICEKEFAWKRTTTYTMLKRLCQREIFQNVSGTVTSLMSKEEFCAAQGQQFLTDTFDGSLPRFLAAFSKRSKLTAAEINEIQKLIDMHREE